MGDDLNKIFVKNYLPWMKKNEDEEADLKMFFVEYRGKLSDELKYNFEKLKALCGMIFTF